MRRGGEGLDLDGKIKALMAVAFFLSDQWVIAFSPEGPAGAG
jgi:hypothetical protein